MLSWRMSSEHVWTGLDIIWDSILVFSPENNIAAALAWLREARETQQRYFLMESFPLSLLPNLQK